MLTFNFINIYFKKEYIYINITDDKMATYQTIL